MPLLLLSLYSVSSNSIPIYDSSKIIPDVFLHDSGDNSEAPTLSPTTVPSSSSAIATPKPPKPPGKEKRGPKSGAHALPSNEPSDEPLLPLHAIIGVAVASTLTAIVFIYCCFHRRAIWTYISIAKKDGEHNIDNNSLNTIPSSDATSCLDDEDIAGVQMQRMKFGNTNNNYNVLHLKDDHGI